MSTIPPDELISAFYDRELTSEEKKVVEDYLKQSPEADHELKEISLISKLIQDLPLESENAPEEFRSAVLKRIERESLLSEVSVPQKRFKQLFPYLTGLTTVACLFLMFQFFSPPAAEFDSVSNEAAVAVSGEKKAKTSGIKLASKNGKLLEESSKSDKIDFLNSSSGLAGISNSLTDKIASNKETQYFFDNTFGTKLSRANLDKDNPVLTASLDGNNLNVIRLTVSNREESLKKLEGYLAKQKIPRNSFLSESEEKRLEKQNKNELSAVYVEASESQITATINKLQSTPDIFSCALEPNTPSRQLEPRFYAYIKPTDAPTDVNSDTYSKRFAKISENQPKPAPESGKTEAPAAPSPEKETPALVKRDFSGKKLVKSKPLPAKPLPAKPLPVASSIGKSKKSNEITESESDSKKKSINFGFITNRKKSQDKNFTKLQTQQMRVSLPEDFLTENIGKEKIAENNQSGERSAGGIGGGNKIAGIESRNFGLKRKSRVVSKGIPTRKKESKDETNSETSKPQKVKPEEVAKLSKKSTSKKPGEKAFSDSNTSPVTRSEEIKEVKKKTVSKRSRNIRTVFIIIESKPNPVLQKARATPKIKSKKVPSGTKKK
jgi:hypothetical protein